jgi:maltose-binding protein MalE
MKTLVFSLSLLLLSSCGPKEEPPRPSPTPLTNLADTFEKSGLGERVKTLEGRVAGLEKELEALASRVAEGVPATPAKDPPAAEGIPAAGTAGETETVGAPTAAAAGKAGPAEKAEFVLTMLAPSTPVTVVVWHAYRGKEKEAFEKVIKEFSAKFPAIQTSPQEVPFSALRDKIVVTIPRMTGPDLFVYAHNNIGDWLLKGDILVPLSSYIEQYDSFESLQRFMPDTVKALAYDGTLYGLPLAFKSHALFYNRKLVDRPPATLDELVLMAKAVSARGGTGEDRVYGLISDASLLYNHAMFAHAFGAEILDEKGRPHLDSPAMIESARLVRSLVAEHEIVPDLNDSMATFLFNSGQAGFVIKGPWFLGEIDEGVDYAVSLLPEAAPGKPIRPFLGSEGVFLSHCSQNKEAAFQVMRYLVSDESARVRYVEGGQLAPNLSLYEDAELTKQANPALEVFKKQAGATVIMSSRPEMQAVWSVADNGLRKVIFGGSPAEEALKEAQAKIEHDIATMGTK